jgi:hypothetical protein
MNLFSFIDKKSQSSDRNIVRKLPFALIMFFGLSLSAKEPSARVSLCRSLTTLTISQGKLIPAHLFHEQLRKSGRTMIARQSLVERYSLQNDLLLSASLNFKNQKSQLRCAEAIEPGMKIFFQAPALIRPRGRHQFAKYWQFQVSVNDSGVEIWNSPLRSKTSIEEWLKSSSKEEMVFNYELVHPDEAVLVIEKMNSQGRDVLKITFDIVSSRWLE